MSGICYIIGAGDFQAACGEENVQYSLNNRTEDDLLIAADGGLCHLRQLCMRPDVIVGDFDSLGECPEDSAADCVLRLPVEKDNTDIGAAILIGRERGFRQFEIYGALGGERIDHSIGNLSLATGLKKSGCQVHLYGRDVVCYFISGGECCELSGEAGVKYIVSVFSVTPKAAGVTLRGLKYPLTDAVLDACVPLGISNEFMLSSDNMEKPVIKVSDGILVIFQQKC